MFHPMDDHVGVEVPSEPDAARQRIAQEIALARGHRGRPVVVVGVVDHESEWLRAEAEVIGKRGVHAKRWPPGFVNFPTAASPSSQTT